MSRYLLSNVIAIVFCIVTVGGICLGAAEKGELTSKDLASLAQKVDSRSADVQSIEVRVLSVAGDEGLVATARVANHGPTSLVIIDRFDGTPILMCAEGRALIYDLDRGCIQLFDSAHFEALAYCMDGKLGIDYRLTAAADHIMIDLPSLLTYAEYQQSSRREGNGWILEGTTRGGGLLVAHVRPGEPFPYSGLTLSAKGQHAPAVQIQPIDVNKDVRSPPPQFPDEKTLAAQLRIVRTSRAATDPMARQEEIAAMSKTLVYRVALREPAARANAEATHRGRIDWSAVAERDRRMSEALRNLVRPATQPVSVSK